MFVKHAKSGAALDDADPNAATKAIGSSKLQISGPIKVSHTGANELLASKDPNAPALRNAKKKKGMFKGIRPSFSLKKRGKKPSKGAIVPGKKPSVSGPMHVVKTSQSDLPSAEPAAATTQPKPAPTPTADTSRRPPPTPTNAKPIPVVKATCSSCNVENTFPPRVLRIACEACGSPVDAPPPPQLKQQTAPPPPRRAAPDSAALAAKKKAEEEAEAERKRKEAEEAERKRKEAEQAERQTAASQQADANLQQDNTDDDDYDDDYEKYMSDCPTCNQPNIFPENVMRIACWECGNPMDAPPGMFDDTPQADDNTKSPSQPETDTTTTDTTHVQQTTTDTQDADADPDNVYDDEQYDDDEGDDDLQGNCPHCGELNLFPEGAPRIACWSCGGVVEADVATNSTEQAEPIPDDQDNIQYDDDDDDDYLGDEEVQSDCPFCSEPNIFPAGAPRIACWSCDNAIDRPS